MVRALVPGFIAVLLGALPCAGQEALRGSEGATYRDVKVSPTLNEVAAVASLPVGGGPAFTRVVSSLHFFDRTKKTRTELTPEGPVFGNLRAGDGCGVDTIAFWPDGRGLLAGGWGLFAAWENPAKMAFLRRGDPDAFLDQLDVNQITAARKGARVALVTTRRRDGDSGPSVECKVVLWDRRVSKDDLQGVRLNKRFDVPVAKLVAAISDDGTFIGCYDKDANKLAVHDASKIEIKQHAKFDLKLPDVLMFRGRPAISFAHDNSALWVLCKEKLYPFDLKGKKAQDPIEFEREPFEMHVLADGSYVVFADIDGKGKGAQTFLNLFNPKTRKVERRVGLGKVVAPISISADDTLLAGCGAESGIYLWDLAPLLKKAEGVK